ncbi:MAG: DUF4365 domain-containing protein [Spirulina sp. SIO3F2]|nr:DUF4365 domain-containing protein [Spirulina sp. SIO3F2]
MKLDLEYFTAERGENLAVVYLTRSHDLAIERLKTNYDYGLDLFVTILRDNLPTGRVFGVQVKAYDGSFQETQIEDHLQRSQSEKNYLKELPFPVCILLFTMDDDRGYCHWLNYLTESRINLHSPKQPQWRSLEQLPIEQLIAEVDAWYDERIHTAA